MTSISALSGTSAAWQQARSSQQTRAQERLFAQIDGDGDGSATGTELQGLLNDLATATGGSTDTTGTDLLQAFDANGSGSLSADEWVAGVQSLQPPPPSTLAFAGSRGAAGAAGDDDLFTRLDTDGDSSVSSDELQALFDRFAEGNGLAAQDAAERVAELDADGDGALSQEEFDAGRPSAAGGPPPGGGTAAASATYDPLDTNEDGVVSVEERVAGAQDDASTDPLQQIFSAIDSDGDGTLTTTEAQAFASALTDAVAGGTSDAAAQGTHGQATPQRQAEEARRRYDDVARGAALQAPTLGSTFDLTA